MKKSELLGLTDKNPAPTPFEVWYHIALNGFFMKVKKYVSTVVLQAPRKIVKSRVNKKDGVRIVLGIFLIKLTSAMMRFGKNTRKANKPTNNLPLSTTYQWEPYKDGLHYAFVKYETNDL